MNTQKENKNPSFDSGDLLDKISNSFKNLGQKLVYSALLMWFAYKRSDTPSWAKNIILGSLTYFLAPIDGIPDLAPFLGYTDDLGVLSFGLVTISCYINEEVRTNALDKIKFIFKTVDQSIISEVDKML